MAKFIAAAVVLLALAWGLDQPQADGVFRWLFPLLDRPVYRQDSFLDLLGQHVALVAVSSSIAVALALAAGIFVTRPTGKVFRPMVETVVSMGQTFPPVAVLAVAVPVVGFGELPALVALSLYGLLPVLQATIAGIESLPQPVLQAAKGMGMRPLLILLRVEMPLALPVWLSGIRTSVIINTGTAAIASTVGAKTLGSPIIVGLSGFNTAYVIQGALLVGLLAIAIDWLFEWIAQLLNGQQRQ